jgi:two-component system sensor histidine kinase UhpB
MVPAPTYLLLVVAVAVSFWYGGVGPSLVSLAIGVFLTTFVFSPLGGDLRLMRAPGLVPILIFVVVCLAVISMLGELFHVRRLAESNVTTLDARNKELRRLLVSRRMIAGEESERRRISRLLHDDVGQELTALRMNLQRIGEAGGSKPDLVTESVSLVDRTLEHVRTLAGELRPTVLDDLGLAAAVTWYANRQAVRAGYQLHIEESLGDERLPEGLETCAFRIVQQALTNVARHAHAKNVTILMRRDAEAVTIDIVDDGVGFDVDAARARAQAGESLGLVHMGEMAEMEGGTLVISSAPGQGSSICILFPLGAGE